MIINKEIKTYIRLCESFLNILEKDQMDIVKKDIAEFNQLTSFLINPQSIDFHFRELGIKEAHFSIDEEDAKIYIYHNKSKEEFSLWEKGRTPVNYTTKWT